MKLLDFDYNLPEDLIAQYPLEKRDNAKLLVVDKNSGNMRDTIFYDLVDILWDRDVLVLNHTKTLYARLYWEMDIYPKSGKEIKKVEILLHKQISLDTWECMWYPGKNLKVWRNIRFYDKSHNLVMSGLIEKVSNMWRYIKFDKTYSKFLEIIENIWEVPLPPYIHRHIDDISKYQTIYAKTPWSRATPTAWLHFTGELLDRLKDKWVKVEYVLLHVWVGTFKPVDEKDIENHYMHSEHIEISKEVSIRLNKYKKDWYNIISVGTTTLRTLESFAIDSGVLGYGKKETDIFIYPWYEFRFIDSLITNFHLPKSTLLMLVSALGWVDNIKKVYKHAIDKKYRFYSFWDAMYIKK